VGRIRAWLAIGVLLKIALASAAAAADDDAAAQITAKDGAVMVLVPAGSFLMGDDDGLVSERPRRSAWLSSFYIDKYEVTNEQYQRFLDWIKKNSDSAIRHPLQPADKDHTPRYWKPFRPSLLQKTGMARLQRFDEATFRNKDHPVVGIDWFDAYAYAGWAGKRLPSEAEWEKAARGTDGRVWPWGNDWDFKKCNSGGYEWKGERDGYIYTAPADSYPQGVSPFGCFNMAGNVWEWTNEWYTVTGGLQTAAATPRQLPRVRRVIKGGGSNSYPSWVRPAARKGYEPDFRYFCLGFRCAKNAPVQPGE